MSPANDYRQRLTAREAQVTRLSKVLDDFGTARLVLAGVILVAGWFSVFESSFSAAWLLLGVAAFAMLVIAHQRARRLHSHAGRAADFYRRGLARIEDQWSGTGQQGTRFDDPHHVYAADLDLFGRGSLFELLCTARTRMGEERLAAWLKSPAPLTVIRQRQAGVADLKSRLDLREELALIGEHPDVGIHPGALLEWAEAPNLLVARSLFWLGLLLPVVAVAGAAYWAITGFGTPFFLTVLVEAAVLSVLRRAIDRVLNGSEVAFADLRMFSELLLRVEREQVSAPPLRALIEGLSSHGRKASQAIGALSTIVNFAGARRNQALVLLLIPLMYPLNVALAAERWRREHGRAVRSWVETIGEFEALLSLAGYAYEHPDDPFPEFVEGTEPAYARGSGDRPASVDARGSVDRPASVDARRSVDTPASFAGRDLGHPLIPQARCVRNDVSITGETRILLVSGSNMSGKSTLLRTVGINTVLAMAGAPVRARALRLTELQIGASIRINDSLHEGSSRFYAEITRLRQVFDLADGRPTAHAGARVHGGRHLLFLLDELLQGTNSRDRRSGAEGIVRALVARGAIGLISTHDLALTDIAGLRPAGVEAAVLHNVHFQDELRDGRMIFDFKLRDGVVTKSNAMELMRSIGLEV